MSYNCQHYTWSAEHVTTAMLVYRNAKNLDKTQDDFDLSSCSVPF